uniref:C2H2-type domain-containing protein n=1 Tax=Strix occidentalis caurina TaxID=311401 RepID=A0A8D0KWQ1_STROC
MDSQPCPIPTLPHLNSQPLLLLMCLKSPQLSPFGLPTGAGTDKQKEEQCQPREEQRGMMQGPEEEPQSPTVDMEHDGQQQPDDTQGSRALQKCSFKGTYDEDPQEGDGVKNTHAAMSKLVARAKRGTSKCPECGKIFRWSNSMRCHQRNYMGERPYKCPDCRKTFKDFSSLISHHRIHKGERPYKCWSVGSALLFRTSPTWRRCLWARELPWEVTGHKIRDLSPPWVGTYSPLVSSHEPRAVGGKIQRCLWGANAPARYV